MSIIINITEENNKLFLTNNQNNFANEATDEISNVSDIVCGNPNYVINFKFSAEWKSKTSKLAVIIIGDKKTAVELVDSTLNLPALPNGNKAILFLMTGEREGTSLISAPLELKLVPTIEADNIPEFEPLSNYVELIISKLFALSDGSLKIKNAEFADNAKNAETASSSITAQRAELADRAVSVQNISNPNLLINGNFIINQREMSTYSTANKYTVDRWKLISGSVTVTSNGINLNGTITQKLEHPPKEAVVASVDTSGGNVTCSYSNGLFTISTTSSTLVKWAKLEIGTVSTIFYPRTYAEELAMCQRYYWKLKNTLAYSIYWKGWCTSSTAFDTFLSLPVSFRTKPTMSINGNIQIVYAEPSNTKSFEHTGFYVHTLYSTQMMVRISASGLTSAYNGIFQSKNDETTSIEFDAELY